METPLVMQILVVHTGPTYEKLQGILYLEAAIPGDSCAP
jgi:hypothetical protein